MERITGKWEVGSGSGRGNGKRRKQKAQGERVYYLIHRAGPKAEDRPPQVLLVFNYITLLYITLQSSYIPISIPILIPIPISIFISINYSSSSFIHSFVLFCSVLFCFCFCFCTFLMYSMKYVLINLFNLFI